MARKQKISWLVVATWRNDHGPRAKVMANVSNPKYAADLVDKLTGEDAENRYSFRVQETHSKLHRIRNGIVYDSVVTRSQIVSAVERDDYTGICTACGEEKDGCEPDARNYKCDVCGALAVFGAEELLMQIG